MEEELDRPDRSTAARRVEILTMLAASGPSLTSVGLCEVARSVTGVAGAGIMLMAADGPVGSLCTTSAVSAAIEDLQYSLGEGPCVDAFHLDTPISEPDLANPRVSRWPVFTGPAVLAGARAIFGFPLRVGSARLGALDLYREQPGAMGEAQHADALVMADIAAETILAMQADAPHDELAAELGRGTDLELVVHQATGMVSVQLDVTTTEALVRLRAHAFAQDRPLREVAGDVVARRLRFSD